MTRKPAQIAMRPSLTDKQIKDACYVGSPEHKTKRWWGGLPGAFADENGFPSRPNREETTKCPLIFETDRDLATCWVQKALTAGQFRFFEADKDYPKKIWYREPTSGQWWFGLCINSIRGEYKGWPIDEDEYHEVFG